MKDILELLGVLFVAGVGAFIVGSLFTYALILLYNLAVQNVY